MTHQERLAKQPHANKVQVDFSIRKSQQYIQSPVVTVHPKVSVFSTQTYFNFASKCELTLWFLVRIIVL
ncbi:MAG TPA: hypothetical protein DCR60_01455 [Psychrobacter sp.]|nr:hypothetical protein [Psychrobacter sp.]